MTESHERADPSDDALVAQADMRLLDDDATAERLEVERATTSWASLLRGSRSPVDIALDDGTNVAGQVNDQGVGWCLVRSDGSDVLVMLDHVVSISGSDGSVRAAALEPGVGMVLRRWASLWCPVVIHLIDGRRLRGRVGAVLADAVLLQQETEPPRSIVVPTSAMVCAKASVPAPHDT